MIDGINTNRNNIIKPTPPTANAGYPINLFFAISDMPPNPAPIIKSIVISSYTPIIFEASEILVRELSYLLRSDSILELRLDNEPATVLFACRMSMYDLYLAKF